MSRIYPVLLELVHMNQLSRGRRASTELRGSVHILLFEGVNEAI